jgi:hypothetical protein
MYNLHLKFEWELVQYEEDRTYQFPNVISPFMKARYKEPAIYRWSVFKESFEECNTVYIGESTELIRRINGYLKPGISQQTNIRMNALFTEYIDKGFSIYIELMRIESLIINNKSYSQDDLNNKYMRRLIENFLIVDHLSNNYTILNS